MAAQVYTAAASYTVAQIHTAAAIDTAAQIYTTATVDTSRRRNSFLGTLCISLLCLEAGPVYDSGKPGASYAVSSLWPMSCHKTT